jgi:hypothetical protein
MRFAVLLLVACVAGVMLEGNPAHAWPGSTCTKKAECLDVEICVAGVHDTVGRCVVGKVLP